ncbi:DNA polymerase I [Patescibacteria group bacterium]|nr:DNA polymerase I [Patescibacteria group bacterium]
MNKEKLVIIDGNALIHRAYHALPPLTTKSGELVNAVYGFASLLLKVLKDLKPDYLVATFDLAAPTFRHKQYKEYKATRVKADQELYDQIPRVKELVSSFNIPIYEKEGFEADDVIGTICHQVKGKEKVIVTGDLDTLQLVDDETSIYTLGKSVNDTVIYDNKKILERYNLNADQMIDYKALRGDPSDNIPGVPGIGEITASKLIKEFSTLEKLYQEIDKGSAKAEKIKDKVKEKLINHKKEALLSQDLSTIKLDTPIKFEIETTATKNFDRKQVGDLFQELEFNSLIKKLPGSEQESLFLQKSTPDRTKRQVDYQLVADQKQLKQLVAALAQQKGVVVDTETTGLNPFLEDLIGISFSFQEGRAFYVPVNHKLKKELVLKQLKPVLEDDRIAKYGHNLKFDKAVLQTAGIDLKPLAFDTMIASYLLNFGTQSRHNLTEVAFSELGYEMMPIESLIGKKGKDQLTMDQVDVKQVSWYSCEDAEVTYRLKQIFQKKLKQIEDKGLLGLLRSEGKDEQLLDQLFTGMEMPLVAVLSRMESAGVEVDIDFLQKKSKVFRKTLADLEDKIYKIAGTKFNVRSTQELRGVLYDKLEIPAYEIKKTKTGLSTAAPELAKIRKGNPIVDHILEHRELTKLKTTYLDALPKLIDPNTGRIHTSYNQTVTATGRLSSSNPNLQNIPIRTATGREIRKAFVAKKGYSLLSADYSQIELRIAAGICQDEAMTKSFKDGEDIHARTAAEFNQIPIDQVTKDQRREAKTVNFGILYGLSPFGLSAQENITRDKAKSYIDTFYQLHQGIKKYVDQVIGLARRTGYVETVFGRRRYLPEINSTMMNIRRGAERMAINMPIQGTAADLMKMAMVKIDDKLNKVSPNSKMILQVHDELVFEVPDNDLPKVIKLVKKEMESIFDIGISLNVDLSQGKNWGALTEV